MRAGWWATVGLALLLAVAGAVVLARQAARQSAAAPRMPLAQAQALAGLGAQLAGRQVLAPAHAGAEMRMLGEVRLLSIGGMHPLPPVRVELCGPVPPLPLLLGVPPAQLASARGGTPVLGPAGMPLLRIAAGAGSGAPLQLTWRGAPAAWAGDAGADAAGRARMAREGWLTWQGGAAALQLRRLPSRSCGNAGALLLQAYRTAGSAPPSQVQLLAFGPDGRIGRGRVPPGQYQVPSPAPAAPQEDAALFAALMAHGLLRVNEAGLAELAPADLAAWRSLPAAARLPLAPAWQAAAADPAAAALLQRLYQRADGSFVRTQLQLYNAERRLLAVRVAQAAGPVTVRAEVAQAPVALMADLPPAASRLFARLPGGWGAWQRVAAWPASARDAGLELRPAAPGPLRLLVVGRLLSVDGARVTQRADACGGGGCDRPDAVQVLTLAPDAAGGPIRLRIAPLDTTTLAATDAPYRHVQWRDGRLAWRAVPPPARAPSLTPSAVTLADRHGTPLWAAGAPTAAARDAGLGNLLGQRTAQPGSVADMLARLPARGQPAHAARLSLDLAWQRQAQAVLDCVGMRRGRWDGRACSGGQAPPVAREAGLVLLDADSGETVAAASAGRAAPEASWEEARQFDRANPAASAWRTVAIEHDGGAQRSPGSTFKLVTALGLELAAAADPALDALLDGLPPSAIDARAQARGFRFASAAPAYPASGAGPRITNYRERDAARRAEDGRLGLAQALAYSVNTWFAWLAEMTDATLAGRADAGLSGVQTLDPDALARLRPTLAMAQRLGLTAPLRLDGGLLPADYPWAAWDVLAPPPLGVDPVRSRHEIRQMAIGLRMQAAPLHMAMVAAALARGAPVTPRLLLELDGQRAAPQAAPPLGVRLDRIRAGMHAVVTRGTGAGAFRDPALAPLLPGLYGKTGTAPTGQQDAAGAALGTVWFTGWLAAGALEAAPRRLAFAVWISHSDSTGGEHAAPVIAALLRGRRAPDA